VNEWGFSAEKCRVIPNPLDPQFLGSLPAHSSRIPGLVVAVGRLEPQKRFRDLISAFADLRRNQASRLVIVGSGSELRALAEYVRERHVEDRVTFAGPTSDVMYWLDRCSLFVLSSGFEGFPNSLAEAMARGCAVVSTDCQTGPSEMVAHGVSGLLVPVGDVAALSVAMRQVLDNQEFASRLGTAARRTAEKWSLESIAPLWV
jgi:glycosyltransferase involved in cell wall biosynthesis